MGGFERIQRGYTDPAIIIKSINSAPDVNYLFKIRREMEDDETLEEGRRMYYDQRIGRRIGYLIL